ncbi:uncharacterized protein [Clytia hemisphaerica]|uniref:uncharacterized protein n=1 Tax=Clytia hemisphaerica TaxID=252671 RepID=UPI0034D77360
MYCWKEFIPMYFIMNKRNYARYGSYYVSQMEHLKQTQPTEYNELVKNGLSIQAQDRYPLATACDQRGEQTINRDAKTAGGVKGYSSDHNNVTKWCLNRPNMALITRNLLDMAGLSGKK